MRRRRKRRGSRQTMWPSCASMDGLAAALVALVALGVAALRRPLAVALVTLGSTPGARRRDTDGRRTAGPHEAGAAQARSDASPPVLHGDEPVGFSRSVSAISEGDEPVSPDP